MVASINGAMHFLLNQKSQRLPTKSEVGLLQQLRLFSATMLLIASIKKNQHIEIFSSSLVSLWTKNEIAINTNWNADLMFWSELFKVDEKIDWHGRVGCSFYKCELFRVTQKYLNQGLIWDVGWSDALSWVFVYFFLLEFRFRIKGLELKCGGSWVTVAEMLIGPWQSMGQRAQNSCLPSPHFYLKINK